MAEHDRMSTWFRVKDLRKGQLMIGYRFNTDLIQDFTWNDSAMLDQGVTHQVDAMPIAGPIFFQDHAGQPWARYSATCAGCAETSKFYKTRHYGIVQWARRHRCKKRKELDNVIQKVLD